MARLASTVFVLGLLAATAAAFALAERLKLEPTPIEKTRVTRLFSPVCECSLSTAYVNFRLRKPDTLTVLIADSSGKAVRTLVTGDSLPAGPASFVWDGRGDDGQLVPDGLYSPRVHLERANRTFDLPNEIRLDATDPVVHAGPIRPRVFSPDGDGHADGVHMPYRLDEPARVEVYVNGRLRVRGNSVRPVGKLDWYGKVGGRPLPPGQYRITLVARDLAQNVSAPTPPVTVRLRYLALSRRVVRVHAGTRFGMRVDTDVRVVDWRLGGREGRSPARPFVIRAPRRPGRYVLVVREHGHSARARVVVVATRSLSAVARTRR